MSDRRPLVLFVGVGIATLAFLVGVLRPTMASVGEKREQLAAAQAEEQSHRDHLASLQGLDADGLAAQAKRLDAWLPDNVRLATFVRQIDAAAKLAGVELTQIAPAAPATVEGAAARQIGLTLIVAGRYPRILDFHRRIEFLDRAVTVGGLAMSGTDAGTGAVSLQATIVATMFANGVGAVPVDPAAADPAAAAPTEGTN